MTLSSHAMLQFPHQWRLLLSRARVEFPYELAPGKNCQSWIDLRDLARELDRVGYSDRYRLVGMYKDQGGNVYKSKSTDFDVARWLRRQDEHEA
ncbi:MAG: hypothetical protein M3Q10_12450 [Chloroflexota bacterium]|nr:hypothetical protein [Chloroflexota bacterium]